MDSSAKSITAIRLDSLSLGDRLLPNGLAHRHSGWEPNPYFLRPALGDCELSRDISEAYERIRAEVNSYRLGGVHFVRHTFMGSELLPINLEQGELIYGPGIGWADSYLEYYMGEMGATADTESVWQVPRVSAETISGPALIVGMPGASVFGHWLLDIIPALHRFRRHANPGGYTLVAGSNIPWLHHFLKLMDFNPRELHLVSPTGAISADYAVKPDLPKHGFGLFIPAVREGLLDFRGRCFRYQHMKGEIVPSPERIFLSRNKWGSRMHREIQNVQKLFEAKGYTVVYPEDHPIERMTHIMRKARIIVGEDGSALHNAIFAPPGCAIAIIENRDFRNFWHMGLAEAFRQFTFYLATYYLSPAFASPAEEGVRQISRAVGDV